MAKAKQANWTNRKIKPLSVTSMQDKFENRQKLKLSHFNVQFASNKMANR